jgi:hypothetical protein
VVGGSVALAGVATGAQSGAGKRRTGPGKEHAADTFASVLRPRTAAGLAPALTRAEVDTDSLDPIADASARPAG